MCEREIKCERNKNEPRNLVSHVIGQHGDEYVDLINSVKEGISKKMVQTKLNLSKVDKKVLNIFGWIDLMMKMDIPFAWAESLVFTKYSKLDRVDHRTLKKYIVRLGRRC